MKLITLTLMALAIALTNTACQTHANKEDFKPAAQAQKLSEDLVFEAANFGVFKFKEGRLSFEPSLVVENSSTEKYGWVVEHNRS